MDALPIERELEFRQLQDSQIKEVAESLESNEDDRFGLIEGLVYRRNEDRFRFYVPESMVNNLIKSHHDELAHCGAEKTYQSLYATYWFSAMRKRIRKYIDNCVVCLIANASINRGEGELQTPSVTSLPFEIVHIDHFGPLQEIEDGYKHVLVVIDAFTRYTWLFSTKTAGTREVLNCLQPLFCVFGNSKELVSDRGTVFTSNELTKYLTKLKVKHRKVAVASPWANRMAERVNRFLKSSLTKTIKNPADWKNK